MFWCCAVHKYHLHLLRNSLSGAFYCLSLLPRLLSSHLQEIYPSAGERATLSLGYSACLAVSLLTPFLHDSQGYICWFLRQIENPSRVLLNTWLYQCHNTCHTPFTFLFGKGLNVLFVCPFVPSTQNIVGTH